MGWEEVDEGWGRLARDFAYLMEPSWWPEFEQVLRDTGVGEGTRYLDVCCGSGLAAQMAGRRGAVVHGLDASQRLIAIAAARSPDGDIRHGDMNDLPWDAGSFDVVTSFRGIWGANDQAVVEAARVLKPGGSLLMADSVAPEDDEITGWMNDIELRRDFSHVENRKISKITELLTERGFTVVENDYPRIYLRFNEWTARTKVSTEETEALRKEFLEAPAATREAFQVAPVHDDIAFSWPCWVFRAVKG